MHLCNSHHTNSVASIVWPFWCHSCCPRRFAEIPVQLGLTCLKLLESFNILTTPMTEGRSFGQLSRNIGKIAGSNFHCIIPMRSIGEYQVCHKNLGVQQREIVAGATVWCSILQTDSVRGDPAHEDSIVSSSALASSCSSVNHTFQQIEVSIGWPLSQLMQVKEFELLILQVVTRDTKPKLSRATSSRERHRRGLCL